MVMADGTMSTYSSRANPAVKASSRREGLPAELSRVKLGAAGADVGTGSHFVAVPEGRGQQPVREFGSFTADLYLMADWLAECGVETVAMESTGVYWIPLFEVLEERGFQVMLVRTRGASRTCPVARPAWWTASGCSNCTATA